MPRPERPLDPSHGPAAEFAAGLRELRERAGRPGYRELARQAHFSAATLAAAASGQRLPTMEVTLAYVRACGGDVDEWRRRWITASRGVGVPQQVNAADTPRPYRGLAAYQPEDAPWFFGRERVVSDLVSRLARGRLVAVFGASGCGKSSTLRAGLIPAVRGDALADGSPPPVVLMTPGPRPLSELAVQFGHLTGVSPGAILDDLATDPARLHLLARQVLAAEPANVDLVLVIDQFEEAFSLCGDVREREGFVAALLSTVSATNSRTRLVLGIRADFLARLGEHPDLVEAVQDSQVLLGPMNATELREAIVRPAERAGLMIEGALVSTIVAELATHPSALPLASHALVETWRRRRGNALTVAGYEAIGGMADAIAQTADRVYSDLDAEQQQTARRLLIRAVTVDEGAQVTRAPVALADFVAPDTAAVAARLAEERLVSLTNDTVEITHEALVDAWPRLRGWIDENREGLRLHRQLGDAAKVWTALGRDAGALYRGLRLALTRQWASKNLLELTTVEREYLEASVAAESRESRAKRRTRRFVAAGLTVSVLVLTALGGATLRLADRSSEERNISLSRRLAADSRRQLQHDPQLALLLAREAFRVRATPEAEAALRQAILESRVRTINSVQIGNGSTVAFSPAGEYLAAADGTGTIRVWRTDNGVALADLPTAPGMDDVHIAFSPDARQIAVGYSRGRLVLWSWVADEHRTILSNTAKVSAVAFGPDGRHVAVGTIAGEVEIHPTNRRSGPRTYRTSRKPVRAIAFRPDGRALAVGGDDGTIQVWSTDGHRQPVTLKRHYSGVSSLTFSPDGRQLVSLDTGAVRVWAGAAYTPVDLTGHDSGLTAAAFSRDNRLVAVTDYNGAVHVWDTAATANPLVLKGHRGQVAAVAFASDWRLVSVATDDQLRTWDVRGQLTAEPLRGHRGLVNDVAFSPDGQRLASASDDGTTRIWSRVSGVNPTIQDPWDTIEELEPITSSLIATRVLFSPDGRGLAAGAELFGQDPHRTASSTWFSNTTALLPVGPTRWWALARPLAFDITNMYLATTAFGKGIEVWDLSVRPPSLIDNYDGVFSVAAFTFEGPRMAGLRFDGSLILENLKSEVRTTLVGNEDRIIDLKFSPDGKKLASASADGSIRIWDAIGGKLIATLPGASEAGSNIKYSPDGRWLINSGDALRIWHDETLEPIIFHPAGPHPETVTINDAGLVATTHSDFTIRVWQCDVCVETPRILELAEQHAVRELSSEERRAFLGA